MEAPAMKPAPFENVKWTDPVSKMELRSTKTGTDGYGSEGTTEVRDPKGKTLWSMPKFLGRYLFKLSPDGKILVLTGDFWFGFALNTSGDPSMAEARTLTFALFDGSSKTFGF
jgi:hypothetical protein